MLDRQLQDTIYQFEHKPGVVAEDRRELRASWPRRSKTGAPIIITTLQKFPFVHRQGRRAAGAADYAVDRRRGAHLADRRSGEPSSRAFWRPTRSAEQAEEEAEDKALPGLRGRSPEGDAPNAGRQANISFFAFTATPKDKTLEMFGRKGDERQAAAVPLYSMRQAIEEGFILDVLANYTTYRPTAGSRSRSRTTPTYDKKKAAGRWRGS